MNFEKRDNTISQKIRDYKILKKKYYKANKNKFEKEDNLSPKKY